MRFPRVHEYTALAGLNRITREPARPRMAILASGLAYAATLRALDDLGLSPRLISATSGSAWSRSTCRGPSARSALRAMVHGRGRGPRRRGQGTGRRRPAQGRPLPPAAPAPDLRQGGRRRPIPHPAPRGRSPATSWPRRWPACGGTRTFPRGPADMVDRHNAGAPIRIDLGGSAPAPRTPYFCSGCPHNISTRADDDQLVGLGHRLPHHGGPRRGGAGPQDRHDADGR